MHRIGSLALCLAVVLAAAPAATPASDSPAERVVVVTKSAPPFAMRDDDGGWTGLSIELWDSIAAELGLEYELREASIPEMLDGLAGGSFDVSAAALTVTAARERRVDFAHPFHSTGLSIAVRADDRAGWVGALSGFVSGAFLRVLLALSALLLLCGLLVWLFERRANPEMFGGTASQGVGSGFWWAAVTMTTVGYGDKSPSTLGGRIVALIWMFASLIVISGFTAAIASSLTVSRLDTGIRGPDDLASVRVGSVPRTTSAQDLAARGVAFRSYDDVEAGLAALADGDVDAVVYDRPILVFLVRRDRPATLRVLPATFGRQDYAFALAPGSALREPLNLALLRRLGGDASAEWSDLQRRYLD